MGRERTMPSLPEIVSDATRSALDTAGEFVGDVASGVSSAVGTAVEAVGDTLADVGEGIQSAVTLTQLLLGAVLVLGAVYLVYNLTGDGK